MHSHSFSIENSSVIREKYQAMKILHLSFALLCGISTIRDVYAEEPEASCQDDLLFTYRDNDEIALTCRDIREFEVTRLELCQLEEVQMHCPFSCGICCEDSSNFFVNCEWIAEKGWRKIEYCGQTFEHRMVQEMCPVACEYCMDPVLTNPPSLSLSPTIAPEPTGPEDVFSFAGIKHMISVEKGQIDLSWAVPTLGDELISAGYGVEDIEYHVFHGIQNFTEVVSTMNFLSLVDFFTQASSSDLHIDQTKNNAMSINSDAYGEAYWVYVVAQVNDFISNNTSVEEINVSSTSPVLYSNVTVVGFIEPNDDLFIEKINNSVRFEGSLTNAISTVVVGDFITGSTSSGDTFIVNVWEIVEKSENLFVVSVTDSNPVEDLFEKIDLNLNVQIARDLSLSPSTDLAKRKLLYAEVEVLLGTLSKSGQVGIFKYTFTAPFRFRASVTKRSWRDWSIKARFFGTYTLSVDLDVPGGPLTSGTIQIISFPFGWDDVVILGIPINFSGRASVDLTKYGSGTFPLDIKGSLVVTGSWYVEAELRSSIWDPVSIRGSFPFPTVTVTNDSEFAVRSFTTGLELTSKFRFHLINLRGYFGFTRGFKISATALSYPFVSGLVEGYNKFDIDFLYAQDWAAAIDPLWGSPQSLVLALSVRIHAKFRLPSAVWAIGSHDCVYADKATISDVQIIFTTIPRPTDPSFYRNNAFIDWSIIHNAGSFSADLERPITHGESDAVNGVLGSLVKTLVFRVPALYIKQARRNKALCAAPSAEPSMIPSSVPSGSPSMPPSISMIPSDIPSENPSPVPSPPGPSAEPSPISSGPGPSSSPSRLPSPQPSPFPTSRPSPQPSPFPSLGGPTDFPSVEHSKVPTAEPSHLPSSRPTASPTSPPSRGSSSEPSRPPSPQPSPFPSLQGPTLPPSCFEDPNYQFLNLLEVLKKCKWIGENLARIERYCIPTRQLHKCPVTCGLCEAPSFVPSDSPSQVPSMLPSDGPSMLPSDSPSEFPTPVPIPSMVPSDSPSMVPSMEPSDSPSKLPSDSPSQLPTTVPSPHGPTSIPSKSPTLKPTTSVKPSPVPSPAPFAQTSPPTKTPTKNPSPQPTACEDTNGFTWDRIVNDETVITPCEYLCQNPNVENTNNRQATWCNDDNAQNTLIKENCCASCNAGPQCSAPTPCDPEADQVFSYTRQNGITQDDMCAWVAESESRIERFCGQSSAASAEVFAKCPVTCSKLTTRPNANPCSDLPETYTFEALNNDDTYTCGFLTQSPDQTVNENRKETYCQPDLQLTACAESCGVCDKALC